MKHPTSLFSGSSRGSAGSGLIEVLVLVFVLSVGMLAMGKMHTLLIKDGGTANNQAIATALAQEKLDDLRAFTWLDTASAAANGQTCGDNVFCFSEIVTNGGGTETGAALNLPAGSVTVGNTTFTRNWTVVDNTTSRIVAVTISWTDQNDANPSTPAHDAHSVVLRSAIARDDSTITALGGGGTGSGAGGSRPAVDYTAGLAPDVIPVPIMQDGTVNKETSKPLPDVVSAGNSVATSFETVTYVSDGDEDTKQILDDFVTVSCVCKFTSSGAGYPASYYYWDTSENPATLKVRYPETTITKNRGVTASNGQHVLCTKCCADHHDLKSNTATALYDPDRPASDYTDSGNGDHKHYYYVNAANPALGLQEVAVANNNVYLEACRFLRVDGYYRLMQDWKAHDMVVMPKDDYLGEDGPLEAYQNYVRNYLRYLSRSYCTEASGTGCSSISQSSAPSKSSLSDRDIDSASGSIQLLSRALYLDRVYGKTTPRTLDSTYYTALAGRIVANQADEDEPWLDIVPFNEVNTTLLTSWASSNTAVVTVTNESISDITASAANYYGVYSRGRATVVGTGNANVTAYLLPSNSGLLGGSKQGTYTGAADYNADLSSNGTISYSSEIGIDKHDHSTSQRKSDYLNISTTASPSISGWVRIGNANAVLNTTDVSITGTGGVTCTLDSPINGVAQYDCSVSSGYTGTLTISSNAAGAFFDHGTDTTYDTESSDGTYYTSVAVSNVTGPVDAGTFWVFSSTAQVRGSINCTPASTCSEITVRTSDNVNCTIGENTVTCPVTLGAGHTWSGSIIMANQTGYNNELSADCVTDDLTTVSASAGPADDPDALTMCVGSGVASLPCTLGTTTIDSGQSLWAYTSTSTTWPTTCSSISQQRTCNNGVLSGSSSYAYDSCSQSAVAPSPSWTGASNPKTLTWPAISGATGYLLYTCTTSNNTWCVPSTSGSGTLTATTSYTPPSLANKASVCVIVKATTGASNSNPSGTYCIRFNNPSTYTYSP